MGIGVGFFTENGFLRYPGVRRSLSYIYCTAIIQLDRYNLYVVASRTASYSLSDWLVELLPILSDWLVELLPILSDWLVELLATVCLIG